MAFLWFSAWNKCVNVKYIYHLILKLLRAPKYYKHHKIWRKKTKKQLCSSGPKNSKGTRFIWVFITVCMYLGYNPLNAIYKFKEYAWFFNQTKGRCKYSLTGCKFVKSFCNYILMEHVHSVHVFNLRVMYR